jgi:branched-chain amino acid aminotransferase
MGHAVMIDGVLVAERDATVSIYDRGFLYGDSVFETIRTYAGRPFALDEHLSRLERSAEIVFIPVPVASSVFASEVSECLRAANNAESYIRVMLTRGQGPLGLDPALAERPLRIILVTPLQRLAQELYETGVSSIVWRTQRALDATGSEGAKIGNYLVSVLAIRAAKAVGAHEALICDANGCVLEGATSNLFFVRGDVVFTPPSDSGILPGITRACVLNAAQSLGLPVRYVVPQVIELKAADEVFISSSIREVLPVVAVDGAPIGSGRPGSITRALHAEFRRALPT